jgi:hypothetical protein
MILLLTRTSATTQNKKNSINCSTQLPKLGPDKKTGLVLRGFRNCTVSSKHRLLMISLSKLPKRLSKRLLLMNNKSKNRMVLELEKISRLMSMASP